MRAVLTEKREAGRVVNLSETLLGLAALSGVLAIILFVSNRRNAARRVGIGFLILALLGGGLELYLQART